ncbi:hypothetical protein [Micromonospora andamanensis]|uniref:hypothetical protein n=1 Tax=Micromonospora andamanensis TaxID=1287068 RepID=UPI001951E7A3|nr:hypothetical protein [Micromonospora andamanensis]
MARRFPDAERTYEAAVESARACGSRFEEAQARRGLGTVAATAGDRNLARACWTDAHTILASLSSPKAHDVRADLDALDSHAS